MKSLLAACLGLGLCTIALGVAVDGEQPGERETRRDRPREVEEVEIEVREQRERDEEPETRDQERIIHRRLEVRQRDAERERPRREHPGHRRHPKSRAPQHRLEHMRAAVEHLRQAGLDEIAHRVAERAEKLQADLRRSREHTEREHAERDIAAREHAEVHRRREHEHAEHREHAERRERELNAAIRDIRRELEQLRNEIQELHRREARDVQREGRRDREIRRDRDLERDREPAPDRERTREREPARDLGRVSGTVTLDGEPLAEATIVFQPATGRPSFAVTDNSGRYELQYSAATKGAKLGRHQVQISTYQEGDPAVEEPEFQEPKPERVPARYNVNAADNPELSVEVTAGSNTIDFSLSSEGEIIEP